MFLAGRLADAAAHILGSQTHRLHRLDQRRRFIEFRRKWRDVPQLDFPYAERDRLYRFVHDAVIGDAPVDYLEFGCYRGASMRMWAELNRHPDSRFIGFDSFEGLPERWHHDTPEGTFNTNGAIPQIGDPRVQFVSGWFQDTVPRFWRSFTPRSRLILHLDADLYSSTIFVLVTLNPPAGALLFFDEFADILNEFRAFEDFLAACRREYHVLAARSDFYKIAIELD